MIGARSCLLVAVTFSRLTISGINCKVLGKKRSQVKLPVSHITSMGTVLNDVIDELGATRVVPGSRTWPDYSQQADAAKSYAAAMQAGDAPCI